MPPNVLFFDLGRGGLGSLFGLKLASALGATNKLTRCAARLRYTPAYACEYVPNPHCDLVAYAPRARVSPMTNVRSGT